MNPIDQEKILEQFYPRHPVTGELYYEPPSGRWLLERLAKLKKVGPRNWITPVVGGSDGR